MEGSYFYWCSWVCWIWATFLMKKTKRRTFFAASVLLLIIFSTYRMVMGTFSVTLSFLFLLFVSLYVVSQNSGWKFGYMFVSTMTIAFLYAAFRLLAIVDPVWVWMDERWMIAIVIVVISLMLHHDLAVRMLSMIVGSCQGDIVYAAAVKGVFPYTIGSLSFFDVLSLSCACLVGWSVLENMPVYADVIQKQMRRNKPL
ncbi:signal transduction histidine kinase [Anoxybacillus tepidamans]|uniref:Signal transduction histidine kinase n=2 Tax=Anoxybacteroides tepidamans TaxID=265948 RepID=A0A7W8IN02_9BACL|nr:signal transduction histidine kinase [Anoxybacillus tepidamans]